MLKVNDAPQQALSFVLSQVTHVESQVWSVKYPDITYQEMIPVDTSANPWARTVTYFSSDKTGKAEWMNSRARDVPLVDLAREKFETEVQRAGIGYDYTDEEIAQARQLGQNLTADKAMAARRAYEEMVEGVAYLGDTSKGFTGLVNNGAVSSASAAAAWAGATADQIMGDINGALTGMWTASKTVELADTILLPLAPFALLTTKRIDATSDINIMKYIAENNIYTAQTGQKLKLRAMRQLNTAGAGATGRLIAYRRDPNVLKMHIPMPLEFLAPQQDGPFRVVVPGRFRLGGLDIRLPGAVRYVDGL